MSTGGRSTHILQIYEHAMRAIITVGFLFLLGSCSDGPTDPGNDGPSTGPVFYTAGAASTCYIDRALDLYCLGFMASVYSDNPAGAGPVARKQALPGPVSAASVFAGNVCAVVEHRIYCRGNNDWGELGTGVVSPTGSYQENYTPIASSVAFDSVVVGNNVACALSTAGKAYCWGSNQGGRAGVGVTSLREPTPRPVAGDLTFRSISGGIIGGFCALTLDGTPHCWGFFLDPVTSNAPHQLQTNVKFRSISLSSSNGCGVDANGILYCWGQTSFGQLGAEAIERLDVVGPEPMPTDLRFKSVAVLAGAVCGLTEDGSVHCRGYGTYGIFGTGERRQRESSFQKAVTPARFVSLSGVSQHVCGRTAANEIYCWGRNDTGSTGEPINATFPNANTVFPYLLVRL